MTTTDLDTLRYPIGKFTKPALINKEMTARWITAIADFPAQIYTLTKDLSPEQLHYTYRPGGWMVKQVVHHCADSHLNAYARFKLSLTENSPIIKPYSEQLWAELPDSLEDDLSDSLAMIQAIHGKWSRLLRTLDQNQLTRGYTHPEHHRTFSLDAAIGEYAWHGLHHFAHIAQALEHKGQFE